RRCRAGQPRVAVLLRPDGRHTRKARLWARLRVRQNYNAGRKGMSMNTEVLSVRRRFQVCAVIFLAALGLAGWARAQESGTRDKVYVVTHVDVVPTEAAAGKKLLQQYVTD